MNYQRQKVPDALAEFYRLLEGVDSKNTSLDFQELQTKFNIFSQYLKNVYKNWFPNAKTYSDEHIAEQLFLREIKKENLKHWTKYELVALTQSFQRIFSNINAYWKNSGYSVQILDELRLLKEMTFETIVFLDVGQFHIKGAFADYGWMKRNVIHSAEAFSASEMLLRNKIYERTIGDFAISPTSIFLLRQAIEIRLKNCLGIDIITDKNGKISKIPGNLFIDLVKTNPNVIDFPVKTSLLIKIYDWTQYYIHGGFVPCIWEIEWAHYTLNPLFTPATFNGTWNLYGSVKIKKCYYNQIETEIKNMLVSKLGKDIVIHRLKSPESIIIE